MDRDREKMAEKLLHLTLEILFRLTGEDYTVVKKTSIGRCQAPVSEGWGRPLSPITGPPPHPLIHEDINDQKILELTYKMIELLTREVPIRCQDVTVYFSMEEWEYLEKHKDLYKGIMMEVSQPLTPPVLSSERTTPERCPRPLLPQGCKQEDLGVPQDHQGEDLPHINTTETYVRGDERCKQKIPTHNNPGDYPRSSEAQLLPTDFPADNHSITEDAYKEHASIPCIPPAPHSKNLLCDNFPQLQISDAPQTVQPNKSQRRDAKHKMDHQGKKPGSSLECGKIYSNKSSIPITHQKAHSREEPYSCRECGKYFGSKSGLRRHQKIHTNEKPFLCPKCGKCFKLKSILAEHQKTHLEKKPYSCSNCGKCFSRKFNLVVHQRTHTGEKPFACTECGKSFAHKSGLIIHQRIHKKVKPYLCHQCGKCFRRKWDLTEHQTIHLEKKPHSCSDCGKCFNRRYNLVTHQKTHTGENPFTCTECGKSFLCKSMLIIHQRIHTGEKPFSCSKCGKCFMDKSRLTRHQQTHKGE